MTNSSGEKSNIVTKNIKNKPLKCIVSYFKYRNFDINFSVDPKQTSLLNYYKKLAKGIPFISDLIKENEVLQVEVENGNLDPVITEPNFFNRLLQLEKTKKQKTIKRNLYDDTVKNIALYYFLLGGRRLYESLMLNFPFPSLSTVLRYLYEQKPPLEGDFMFKEFSENVKENGDATKVWVSEDDTKITEGLSYNKYQNTIIGFKLPTDKETGTPKIDYFKFTSVDAVRKYLREHQVSSYAKLLAVRALNRDSKPFILSVYGTNGSDVSEDIIKRWKYIVAELEKVGIQVMG